MAKRAQETATREDVIAWLTSTKATDPDALEWTPLGGLFRGTLRLRMTITEANISDEMVEAYRTARYPEVDVPEVGGLLRALADAGTRVAVDVRIAPGTREMMSGLVGYFEPHRILLPFARARLRLTVAPAEFQWVLEHPGKEKGADGERLEALKRELLAGTREWVRRGNR